jgi:hypothetical protein
MAPYKASILDLVTRFATSPQRAELLKGLLSYRKALAEIGIGDGFQWIDGSFVEDVETSRKRSPADIDLVTFANVPTFDTIDAKRLWVRANIDLFDRVTTEAAYQCDAFFVDLGIKTKLLVDDTRYWFGLFSHQRETSLWKGMVQIPLNSNDEAAREHLRRAAISEEESNDA